MQTVGATVRALRERRGMDRGALARAVGLGYSQIEKLERGARGTTTPGYKRLADALGVPLHELFAPPGESVAPPTKDKAPVRSRRRQRAPRVIR